VARSVPTPKPAAGQILVKVAAAGVNRPDVQQRIGAYPPPAGHSPLPGLEIAGTVAAVGSSDGRWKVGDKVCASGQRRRLCRVRDRRGRRGAADPGRTRHGAGGCGTGDILHGLEQRVRARGGSSQASGCSCTAAAAASARRRSNSPRPFGAKVVATAGSAEKCKACLDLGADRAVNYRTEDFVAAVKEATGGKGVNVTLDMVGGDYTDRNIIAAAEGWAHRPDRHPGRRRRQDQHRAP